MQMKFLLTVLMLAMSLTIFAEEYNWPFWRGGPEGNSVSTEKGWNPKAIENPKVLWKKELGVGYSQVHIWGKYMVSQGFVAPNNVVYCYDEATAKELWTFKYKNSWGTDKYKGSTQTPIIFRNKVYVVSRDSDLYCLNIETGKVIWHKNIMKEYKVTIRDRGYCTEIKTYKDDKLFLNTGKNGTLIEADTGKTIYSEPGDTRYGVPVFYKVDGRDAAVMWGPKQCFAIDLETGKRLWDYPWKSNGADMNAPDQLVIGNRFFLTAHKHPGEMIEVNGKDVKKVWGTEHMECEFTCPVYIDGYIYGTHGRNGTKAKFNCIDAKTGELQWSAPLGFGNFNIVDNKFIFNSERCELTIFEVNPKKFVKIASGKVDIPRKLWAPPVLCRGKLYIKSSTGTLVCIDMK